MASLSKRKRRAEVIDLTSDDWDIPKPSSSHGLQDASSPPWQQNTLGDLQGASGDKRKRKEPIKSVIDVDDDEDPHAVLNLATAVCDLARDFRGIVAAGYRPGLTRIAQGTVVSISVPVSSLEVPYKYLEAWDPALVDESKPVYLTLLTLVNGAYEHALSRMQASPPRFAVGLSNKAKPSAPAIIEAFRVPDDPGFTYGDFEPFALSKLLKGLLSTKFGPHYLHRLRNPKLGWAGAEHALQEGASPAKERACRGKDKAEAALTSYKLPVDPLSDPSQRLNVPLAAFHYLLRRFVMCCRFCVACTQPITELRVASLRPHVCEAAQCVRRFKEEALGVDLEGEIRHNGGGVDLLIQFAFVEVMSGRLEEPPKLDLRVNQQELSWCLNSPRLTEMFNNDPREQIVRVPDLQRILSDHNGALVDADQLTPMHRKTITAAVINDIRLSEMRQWLQGNSPANHGQKMPQLVEMRNGSIPNVVWQVLKWIIASNSSYLREITRAEDLLPGVPKEMRQFRLLTASPEREQAWELEVVKHRRACPNLEEYPQLFSFHGSPFHNWTNILRAGLHFNTVVNGRSHGDGVYMGKQLETSAGYCMTAPEQSWRNASRRALAAMAVCRVVNLPHKFQYSDAFYVCQHIDWITTRVLLVSHEDMNAPKSGRHANAALGGLPATFFGGNTAGSRVPPPLPAERKPNDFVRQDPKAPLTSGEHAVWIPDHSNIRRRRAPLFDLNDVYTAQEQALLLPTVVDLGSPRPSRCLAIMSEPAIEVDDLTFAFSAEAKPVLTGIDLNLPAGSRCLLIGANGAGKSTLLQILAGKRLTRSKAKVLGQNVFFSTPPGVTYLGTEWAMNSVVRSDLGVSHFLDSIGGWRHKERRDALLDILDVDLEWRMHQVSDGERRRVQIVQGLMAPWQLLLLDEVTVDLDVLVRSRLLAFLQKETEERNATIVYATHIFDGLDRFPTHVCHLQLGKTTTPSPLKWPLLVSQKNDDVPEAVIKRMDDPDRAGSRLLELALHWLTDDKKAREAAPEGTYRPRGAKSDGVTSDSEAFYRKYDYSH